MRSASYYYKKARAAARTNNYKEAIRIYSQALEVHSQHLPSHLGLAEAYTRLSSLKEAESSYDYILRIFPKNKKAITALAQIAIKLDKMEKAQELLALLQKEFQEDAESSYLRGLWYAHKDNPKLAQLYFRKALHLRAEHIPSRIALLRLWIKQKQTHEAQEEFEQISALAPFSPELYKAKAALYAALSEETANKHERKKILQRAYHALLEARTLAPYDREIDKSLIYMEIRLQNYKKALRRIQEWGADIGGEEEDPQFMYLKALLKIREYDFQSKTIQKELAQDLRALQRALQLAPQDILMRRSMEGIAIRGDKRKSENTAGGVSAQLRQLGVKLSAYHVEGARRHRRAYRHDFMQSHLRRALLLHPLSLPALRMSLSLAQAEKDYEAMFFFYQRLLQLEPQNVKLRYRFDRAWSRRTYNIAYRESLFNPALSSEKGSFQRSSFRIFIFDLSPEQSYVAYPDASRNIAEALSAELTAPGPVQSPSPQERLAFFSKLQVGQSSSDWDFYYHSDHSKLLRKHFKRAKEIHYLLSGSYRYAAAGSLQLSCKLHSIHTGLALQSFHFKSSQSNALVDLAIQLRGALLAFLPVEGKIIKRARSRNEFYINLGKYDGINTKSKLRLLGYSPMLAGLQIVELGPYISRVRLLSSKASGQFRLHIGDRVMLSGK